VLASAIHPMKPEGGATWAAFASVSYFAGCRPSLTIERSLNWACAPRTIHERWPTVERWLNLWVP